MLESIAVMWNAFTLAVVRFWDNRFILNDETDFLRRQIELLHADNRRLLNLLLEPLASNNVTSDNKSYEPVSQKKFIPWSVKKHQLEKESIEKLEREVLLRNNAEPEAS